MPLQGTKAAIVISFCYKGMFLLLFEVQSKGALSISAFRPTFEVAELDNRTKNVALTIWVLENKELDIAVAD
jgi:hypothetical protein